MLGNFIARDFIATAGEMRQFLASNENTALCLFIRKVCVAGIKTNFVKFCFSAQGTKETGQALDRLGVRIYD